MLAWDGGRLVGTIMAGWDGWRASMARLAIDPQYRRIGLARALVERIEGASHSRYETDRRDRAEEQSRWARVLEQRGL